MPTSEMSHKYSTFATKEEVSYNPQYLQRIEMHSNSGIDHDAYKEVGHSNLKRSKYLILAIANVIVFVIIFIVVNANSKGNDDNTNSTNNNNAPISPLSVSPFPSCNVGPMHHTHLILPLSKTVEECSQSTSRFMLSHGATFFCPHTWDIKLLAQIVEDDARATTCQSYFNALATGQSPLHAFRPTLEQGGLPQEALGQLTSWMSPVIYWVHNFANDPPNPDGGPDGGGWNTTTIVDTPTTVILDQVMYSRQFDLQPSPAELTYLVHAPMDGNIIILTHYISTAGPSGFSHIITVNMTRNDGISDPLVLRPTWPLYLTLPGITDSNIARFIPNTVYNANLNVYSNITHLPLIIPVQLNIVLDYYYGIDDGFSAYGQICPNDLGSTKSPTMCMPPGSTVGI